MRCAKHDSRGKVNPGTLQGRNALIRCTYSPFYVIISYVIISYVITRRGIMISYGTPSGGIS